MAIAALWPAFTSAFDQAGRIDRKQARPFGDSLFGRSHRENGGEDRPDAWRPSEGKGKTDHIGAPKADWLGDIEPFLPMQKRNWGYTKKVQSHDDDDDAGDGRKRPRIGANEGSENAGACTKRHEYS